MLKKLFVAISFDFFDSLRATGGYGKSSILLIEELVWLSKSLNLKVSVWKYLGSIKF